MRADFFVDRVEHIAALETFAGSVTNGEGGALTVQGPAGVGKSALLREFVRRCKALPAWTHYPIVVARCHDQVGEENAYGPIAEMLAGLRRPRRHLLRRVGRSAVQLAPDLLSLVPAAGPLLKVGGEIAKSAFASGSMQGDSILPYRQSLARVVALAIADAVRERGSALVILDDFQWIDPSSLLVLDHLMDMVQDDGLPLGLALGHRTERSEPGRVSELLLRWDLHGCLQRLTLGGLPDAAVAELVYQYRETAPSWVPTRLASLTGGHPVFVMQCLHLVGTDGMAHGSLPRTVEAMIESRLVRIDETTLELLSIGAIQGESFLTSVLELVSGMAQDEVLLRLHQVSREHGLIIEEDPPTWIDTDRCAQYRFEHALLQLVLADRQSREQSRIRHARIADVLAAAIGDPPLEMRLDIARHYRLGGRWDDSAREHFGLAQSLAVNGLSFSEAESLCRQAIHDLRRLTVGTERDKRLAEAIELLLNLTEVRWQGNSTTGSESELESLAKEAEQAACRCADLPLIARATLLYGKVVLHTRGLVPSLEKLEEAVALSRQCADPAALFVALAEYGRQLPKRDLAAGLSVLREAEQLYHDEPTLHHSSDPVLRHARNLTDMQLGVNMFDAGRFSEAISRLQRCVARLRDDRLQAELPIVLNYLAQVQTAMGAWRDAEASLREALQFEEDRGGPSGWHAYNTALLALVLTRDPAEWERCQKMAQAGWRETEQTWLVNLVPIVRNLYTEVLLITASADRAALRTACNLAEETIRETRRTGMVRSEIAGLSLQSRIRLQLGDVPAAARLGREAVAILDRVGDLPALRTEEVQYHTFVVLQRAGISGREADTLLTRAFAEVLRKANSIEDASKRERFMEEVPLNRSIKAALRDDN